MARTLASITHHSKIFSKTSWGLLELGNNNDFNEMQFQIAENRDSFVFNSHIKRVIDVDVHPSSAFSGLFDHVEFYRGLGKYIIMINSPYNHIDGDCYLKIMQLISEKVTMEYEEMPPLYHYDAFTFKHSFYDNKCYNEFIGHLSSINNFFHHFQVPYLKKHKKIIVDDLSIDDKAYAILNEIEPAIKLAIAKALQS
jgi:hypothetical protein